jgi:hypothetical protein
MPLVADNKPRIYLQHNKPTKVIELLDLPPGSGDDSEEHRNGQDVHYTAISTRVACALRQDLRASRNTRLRSPRKPAMMVCLTVPKCGHEEIDGTHSRIVLLRNMLEGLCRNARCMDADAHAPPQQQMLVCLMLGPADACLLQYCSENLRIGKAGVLEDSPAEITMHVWEAAITITDDVHFDSTFAPLRFMLVVNMTKEATASTLPVLREWFLEGLCEEIEPLACSCVHGVIPHDQALLVAAKQLQKSSAVGGICGQIARQQTQFSPLSMMAGFHAASVDSLQRPLLHLSGFSCLRFEFCTFRFAAVRVQAATSVEVRDVATMRDNTAGVAAAPGHLGSCCTRTWEALASVAAMCWVERSAARSVTRSSLSESVSGSDSPRIDAGLNEWMFSFAMLRRGYHLCDDTTMLADRHVDSITSATLDEIITETGNRYLGDFIGTAHCLVQGWDLIASSSSSGTNQGSGSGGGCSGMLHKVAVVVTLSLQLSEAFVGALSFAHLQLLMLVALRWTRAGTGSVFLGPQWCTDGVHGGAAADTPCADTFQYSDVIGPHGPLIDTRHTWRPIKLGSSTARLPMGAFCGGYLGSANSWTVEGKCQTMIAGSIQPLSGQKVYDTKNLSYYMREASKPLHLQEEWLRYVTSIALRGETEEHLFCNGHLHFAKEVRTGWQCTALDKTVADHAIWQIFVSACKEMDLTPEQLIDLQQHPPFPPENDVPYGYCRTVYALPECYDNQTIATAYKQFGGVKLCDHTQSIFLLVGTSSLAAVTSLMISFLGHSHHMGESPDQLGVVTVCCSIFAI